MAKPEKIRILTLDPPPIALTSRRVLQLQLENWFSQNNFAPDAPFWLKIGSELEIGAF